MLANAFLLLFESGRVPRIARWKAGKDAASTALFLFCRFQQTGSTLLKHPSGKGAPQEKFPCPAHRPAFPTFQEQQATMKQRANPVAKLEIIGPGRGKAGKVKINQIQFPVFRTQKIMVGNITVRDAIRRTVKQMLFFLKPV